MILGIVYLKVYERIDLENSLHKKKMCNYVSVMDVNWTDIMANILKLYTYLKLVCTIYFNKVLYVKYGKIKKLGK